MNLAGRTLLLTGAAGRLGRVMTEHFLREGAVVAAIDRNEAGLHSLRRELGSNFPPDFVTFCADVSEPGAVEALAKQTDVAMGQIDILVNCAGLSLNSPVVEVSVEEWDLAFTANVRSMMLMCQAYARQWIERGVKGAIVNISSGAATSPRAGGGHYAGAKAAVDVLTRTLAIELGPHGIRVNAVAPGVVLDKVITGESPEQHEYINQTIRGTPLGRTGTPLDIAQAVVFLASGNASWITGEILSVSGGSHAGRTHVPPTRNEKLA